MEPSLYLDPSGESRCVEPPSWFEEVLRLDKDGVVLGLGKKPVGGGASGKVYLVDPESFSGEVDSNPREGIWKPAEVCHRVLQEMRLLNRAEVNFQKKAILKVMPKASEGQRDWLKKNTLLRKECYILHLVSQNELQYRNLYNTSLNPLLYGCFESQDRIYILMEAGPKETLASIEIFKEGETKDEVLRASEKQVSVILVKILLALRRNLFNVTNHLRESLILHRDVKLANVLFDVETRKLMLIDWGSAAIISPPASEVGKTLADLGHTHEMMSLSSEIQGTRAYMAPEVLASEGTYLHQLMREQSQIRELLTQNLVRELEQADKHSSYGLQADIWSTAVTIFLVQYGMQTQDNSPFAPPEWDMHCEEDWDIYSDKTILHTMLVPCSSLEHAPEGSGKRFKDAETISLLPGLLRAMLRPNTHAFEIIRGESVSESRVSLEFVLKHNFSQAALDSDQLLRREVDVALQCTSSADTSAPSTQLEAPSEIHKKRLFSEMTNTHEVMTASGLREEAPPSKIRK